MELIAIPEYRDSCFALHKSDSKPNYYKKLRKNDMCRKKLFMEQQNNAAWKLHEPKADCAYRHRENA